MRSVPRRCAQQAGARPCSQNTSQPAASASAPIGGVDEAETTKTRVAATPRPERRAGRRLLPGADVDERVPAERAEREQDHGRMTSAPGPRAARARTATPAGGRRPAGLDERAHAPGATVRGRRSVPTRSARRRPSIWSTKNTAPGAKRGEAGVARGRHGEDENRLEDDDEEGRADEQAPHAGQRGGCGAPRPSAAARPASLASPATSAKTPPNARSIPAQKRSASSHPAGVRERAAAARPPSSRRPAPPSAERRAPRPRREAG